MVNGKRDDDNKSQHLELPGTCHCQATIAYTYPSRQHTGSISTTDHHLFLLLDSSDHPQSWANPSFPDRRRASNLCRFKHVRPVNSAQPAKLDNHSPWIESGYRRHTLALLELLMNCLLRYTVHRLAVRLGKLIKTFPRSSNTKAVLLPIRMPVYI